jgi:gluconolactonase
MSLVDAVSPRMAELIDPDAEPTRIADGCMFTEGPLWVAAESAFYFSDMPGDTRRKWTAEGGVEVVASPSNKVNGTTLDGAGRQVICEHSTSSVVRLEHDGARTLLATHWDGKELNSPNDVVLRSDGQIYFSDPPYGRWPGFGVERERELDICGLFRIDGAGELHLEVSDFNKPNGLCFSVDESVLFVNDTEELNIRRFDVAADGSLSGGEVVFQMPGPLEYSAGVPDGMKLDAAGNLWCTGPGGVWVVSPDGEHLGTLRSEAVVGNIAWGDDDFQTLFLCTSDTVHTVRTKVAGNRPVFFQ